MNGYYAGKIKVVPSDFVCFPCDPQTLEPTRRGLYDPYAWTDPETEPVETITFMEWTVRCNERRKERGGSDVKARNKELSSR